MVYVDSSGQLVEKKFSIIGYILSFFSFFVLFFQSLFGFDTSSTSADDHRNHLRRTNGGERWSGSGGPGGPGSYNRDGGGGRRQIGRLPRSSGMSCPPMGGGG